MPSPGRVISFSIICLTLASCDQKAKRGDTKEIAAEPSAPKVAPPQDPGQAAPPAPRPRPKLERSQPLPDEVRLALRHRMRDHGDDMEGLLWSVLMLDYESTSAIADRMTMAPHLARPGPGAEGTLNEHLPPAFFTLQDELRTAIVSLKSSSDSKNNAQMAREYARIAETCIQCHGLYLEIPPPE